MAAKSDILLKEKLAALNNLRITSPDKDGQALLVRALGDRTNLVVAAAAEVIGEWQISSLEPELVLAYDRLAVDGLRRDPSCAGKIAVAVTLQALDITAVEFWLNGLRYIQMEPSFGPPIDTGAHIRALSALSVARSGHPDTLLELTPLLQDPAMDARLGAIQAIGSSGQPGAVALLWHKLMVGDAEPEPYYEAFVNVLVLNPERALPFVATFLQHHQPGVPESAVLALGETRRAEALPFLQDALETADNPASRRSIFLGIALLRLDAAMEFLLEVISDGPWYDAESAMKALEIVRPNERVEMRVQAAFAARSGRR